MIHVLLVDDDPELRSLLCHYLSKYGMEVTAVGDGASLRLALARPCPVFDVLLLDLMLPDASGLDLCQHVRKTSHLPIVMLTAQGDPASRIVGLELGADDYLPKPFEPRELVARINAVLRRTGAAAPEAAITRFNGWTFDRVRRQLVSPNKVLLALSAAEFRLLCAFVDHPRRVLSRERLLELTRTGADTFTDRAVDLAISRLRQKMVDASLIRTVRGQGYSFEGDLSQ